MSEPAETATAKPKRKKSQKRQRQFQLKVPCLATEFNNATEASRAAGLSKAAWARTMMFGDPGPRSQRVAPVEKELLLRTMGALGRLNNNVNQIARALNMNDFVPPPEIRSLLKDYIPIRDAIFEALSKTPSGMALKAWHGFAREIRQLLDANPQAETVSVPAEVLRRMTEAFPSVPNGKNNPDTQPRRSAFMPPGKNPGGKAGA